MQKTKIDYLTHTWNPIAMSCTPVSAGCDNCWHLDIRHRFKMDDFGLREKELNAPLSHKKPCTIGVQFMGDLFHESVPFEWIDRVWDIINIARQHTFQILTKRPERMKEYVERIGGFSVHSNMWLGVTAENQETADKRIPILLDIPAAVRFVSCEPLLEEIDMTGFPPWRGTYQDIHTKPKLDWVIVGAESGAGRRECNVEWVHDIVLQCTQARVPVFVKQIHGENKKVIKSPMFFPQQFPNVKGQNNDTRL